MELLTLFRFRSNVEWIWRPKPFKSHLPRAGIFTVYLYIYQNFHLWKLWGTLYCKVQLLPYQISWGEFSGSVEQLQVLEGFLFSSYILFAYYYFFLFFLVKDLSATKSLKALLCFSVGFVYFLSVLFALVS